MSNYIVYEFYKVETNEIFYVGQGKVGRNYQVGKGQRSKAFDEVYNSCLCKSRVIHSNLTQEQAWELEIETIKQYRELGYPLVNVSVGGKYGANGINYTGECNPMFGVTPKDRMSPEVYEQWRIKQRARKFGETNPNYGNTTLKEKYKANPQLALEKQSRPGKQNGRCVPVELWYKGKFVKRFDYKGECAQYLLENNLVTAKTVNSLRDIITKHIKNDSEYCGFKFKLV